jgi:RNA polymerase sigma factor (sigma-70 family)
MIQPSLDRQTLILAAQTGDVRALNHLVTQCQTDARRYARRHCQAADVDDAVQEALIILSRRITGLRAVSAFSSWLFTIVRRECARLARRMLRQGPSIDELADAQLQTRPSEGLRLDLIAALESLPAHYLEIILLRDFEELSIAELAERLGLQIPGAKSRLHRARELVREYLLGTPPSPRVAE